MSLICGLLAFFAAATAQPAPEAQPHKIAVIVAANKAAPGRRPLRYSHLDARAFGEILVALGGFAPNDVHTLSDPTPDQILTLLDQRLAQTATESGRETMLLFYYSGHADQAALYPNGQPLRVEDLRKRLDDERVAVRVGIIDASAPSCHRPESRGRAPGRGRYWKVSQLAAELVQAVKRPASTDVKQFPAQLVIADLADQDIVDLTGGSEPSAGLGELARVDDLAQNARVQNQLHSVRAGAG